MDFKISQKVKLKAPLPYLKTSDNMPMLRPPDLVSLDEVGIVIGLRAKNLLEVSFRRGKFLIPSERLKIIEK